jgi:hypothetical protein
VVIPEHLCEGGFNIKGKVRRTVFESIEFTAFEDTLIKDIGEGMSIEGPGLFHLKAEAKTKYISKFSVDAELSLALKPSGASPAISINVMLPLGTPLKDEVSRWSSSLGRHAGAKLLAKKLADEAFKKFERGRILRG